MSLLVGIALALANEFAIRRWKFDVMITKTIFDTYLNKELGIPLSKIRLRSRLGQPSYTERMSKPLHKHKLWMACKLYSWCTWFVHLYFIDFYKWKIEVLNYKRYTHQNGEMEECFDRNRWRVLLHLDLLGLVLLSKGNRIDSP